MENNKIMNFDKRPLVSIVTIVYNGVSEIEQTIESVINQDYENSEFIVIDGGSNDGTQEIIEKYKDKITYYISEKDNGIYDAMNKGIKASEGSWVNFMNAGDTFYSNTVLTQVFLNTSEYANKALLYGYKFTDGVKSMPHKLEILEKGIIMANHQSMFFNKKVLREELMYSLNYPIYGDYELVYRIYKLLGKVSFHYLDIPIAIYEGGGISSVVSFQKRKDKFKILLKFHGVVATIKAFIYGRFFHY